MPLQHTNYFLLLFYGIFSSFFFKCVVVVFYLTVVVRALMFPNIKFFCCCCCYSVVAVGGGAAGRKYIAAIFFWVTDTSRLVHGVSVASVCLFWVAFPSVRKPANILNKDFFFLYRKYKYPTTINNILSRALCIDTVPMDSCRSTTYTTLSR